MGLHRPYRALLIVDLNNPWGSRPRLFYAAPSGLRSSELKMPCAKEFLEMYASARRLRREYVWTLLIILRETWNLKRETRPSKARPLLQDPASQCQCDGHQQHANQALDKFHGDLVEHPLPDHDSCKGRRHAGCNQRPLTRSQAGFGLHT